MTGRENTNDASFLIFPRINAAYYTNLIGCGFLRCLDFVISLIAIFSDFQAYILDNIKKFSKLLVIMNNMVATISCLCVTKLFCCPYSITIVMKIENI